jgi:uncharacterized membrane protein YbhN (UPF0104 family)
MTPDEPAPRGLTPEAVGARPGPGSVFLKVLSAALSGGLVVVLFWAIIPKITEFSQVGEELKSMSAAVVIAMLAMALTIRLALAESYAVLTPGVSLWKNFIAKEASTTVSNVVPGPSGTAAQWAILRSWGLSTERFARATVSVSTTTYVLILVAPGVLFVIWALLGMPSSPGGHYTLLVGLAGLVLSAVTLLVVAGIARSVKLAAWLGRLGQKCVNPFRRLFGKPSMTDWEEKTVHLRADLIEELQQRGGRLFSWVFANYGINGVLLVVCLWACGATYKELPLTLGLILYGIGRVLTIIQVTPGGVGVTEIIYTSVYVAVLGESAHDSVVAGVLLYRALTYALPIVSGAFAYLIWRLMRRSEIHEEREKEREAERAAEEAAPAKES